MPAPSSRAALSYRQFPAASAVTGLVVRYLAVFNVVSRFYHWRYCYFYHCTTRFMLSCSCWLSNDACYIPWFYQLRVFYAKCFVRNDEIKLWNQSYIPYHRKSKRLWSSGIYVWGYRCLYEIYWSLCLLSARCSNAEKVKICVAFQTWSADLIACTQWSSGDYPRT